MTERERQADQLRTAMGAYIDELAQKLGIPLPPPVDSELAWGELPDYNKGLFLALRDEAAVIFAPAAVEVA